MCKDFSLEPHWVMLCRRTDWTGDTEAVCVWGAASLLGFGTLVTRSQEIPQPFPSMSYLLTGRWAPLESKLSNVTPMWALI